MEKLEVFYTSPDCQIVTTRTFNYSLDKLYKAWTDPNHLKNWWWPNGFTNTFHTFEFIEWWNWNFIMHGPNNDDYINDCTFVKIDPYNLIVFNHNSAPKFQVEVTFTEVEENKTMVVFKQKFGTAEECERIKVYAAGKNEENMDRLEQEIKKI